MARDEYSSWTKQLSITSGRSSRHMDHGGGGGEM